MAAGRRCGHEMAGLWHWRLVGRSRGTLDVASARRAPHPRPPRGLSRFPELRLQRGVGARAPRRCACVSGRSGRVAATIAGTLGRRRRVAPGGGASGLPAIRGHHPDLEICRRRRVPARTRGVANPIPVGIADRPQRSRGKPAPTGTNSPSLDGGAGMMAIVGVSWDGRKFTDGQTGKNGIIAKKLWHPRHPLLASAAFDRWRSPRDKCPGIRHDATLTA